MAAGLLDVVPRCRAAPPGEPREPPAPRARPPPPLPERRPARRRARRPRRGRPQHGRPRVRRPLLIIDCGVLFPEDNQPGVDLILPDFDYIEDRLDDIEAIVLTHGHEDHIGAVPYLLRLRARHPRSSARSSRSRFVEAKLKEHRIAPRRCAVAEGDRAPRRVRRASSSRSTTRSRTRSRSSSAPGAGTVLHTGDFKMDQLPLDGRLTDLRAFARLGEEGVDLFMVDSTNAEMPGLHAPREGHRPGARPGVRRVAQRRIVVASLRLARAPRPAGARRRGAHEPQGRAASGRSMVRNMAHRRGARATSRSPTASSSTRRRSTTCPTTRSCSSAPARRASRWRRCRGIANHDHKIAVGPGDTVMLASSLIPGNENAVYRVINGLTRLGRTCRAQGQRAGARLRARERRRAPLLLQHPEAAQRHADPRRGASPESPTASSRCRRVCRRSGSCWPRTAS